jgi:CheY-like chemotaxis protein
MKILVVDDDAMAGEMTGAVLEELGHEVVMAEDGDEATEKLDAHPEIGLIVSDMNMPTMSGIDLFRKVREQGGALPFVLLTGDDPRAMLVREPRLDACLPKDYTIEESLPAIITQVLARHGHA